MGPRGLESLKPVLQPLGPCRGPDGYPLYRVGHHHSRSKRLRSRTGDGAPGARVTEISAPAHWSVRGPDDRDPTDTGLHQPRSYPSPPWPPPKKGEEWCGGGLPAIPAGTVLSKRTPGAGAPRAEGSQHTQPGRASIPCREGPDTIAACRSPPSTQDGSIFRLESKRRETDQKLRCDDLAASLRLPGPVLPSTPA